MLTTRKQHVYRYLHRRLLDGTFSPNQRLLPAALAREIGVSQIPVREAINQLQSEGLVVQSPHHGVFVRSTRREEFLDLLELRRVLECNAAAQAARRITDITLNELRKSLREMHRVLRLCGAARSDEERLSLTQDYSYADMNFHMALLRAAGNQSVIKALNEANVLTQMVGRRTDVPDVWRNPGFFAANYSVHRKIFEAVRRHDAKGARHAMAIHMNRARKNTLARLDWLQHDSAAGQELAQEFPESMREIIADVQRQSSTQAEKPADEE
jgi:DNA-binding GntR family transcriptional regulator